MTEPIRNPENYEAMVKAYEDQQEKALEKLQTVKKAETQEDLVNLAKQAVVQKALRRGDDVISSSPDSPTPSLSEHKIVRDPQSKEVADLKNRLLEQIRRTGDVFQQAHPSNLTEEGPQGH